MVTKKEIVLTPTGPGPGQGRREGQRFEPEFCNITFWNELILKIIISQCFSITRSTRGWSLLSVVPVDLSRSAKMHIAGTEQATCDKHDRKLGLISKID